MIGPTIRKPYQAADQKKLLTTIPTVATVEVVTKIALAETPPADAPQKLRIESGPMIKNAKSAGGHWYPSAARLAIRMMFNVMRIGFILASLTKTSSQKLLVAQSITISATS
jgi:hypothetical protein